MNLEQINTSTTAGKAEVMRLAAEGRQLVFKNPWNREWTPHSLPEMCDWNWSNSKFAIIAKPVGPDELYVVMSGEDSTATAVCNSLERARLWNVNERMIVRYIRAGEAK